MRPEDELELARWRSWWIGMRFIAEQWMRPGGFLWVWFESKETTDDE